MVFIQEIIYQKLDMLVDKGSRASSQGRRVIGGGKGTIRSGQDL